MDHRTLASTAARSWASGGNAGSTVLSPGRMLRSSASMPDRVLAPRNLNASAASTAPHPSCPSTTKSGV